MELDRRRFVSIGGLWLTAPWVHAGGLQQERSTRLLDRLLTAHASCLPEADRQGTNHAPMAAEALEALGYESAIGADWIESASRYRGELPRLASLSADSAAGALGTFERYGDWLDLFQHELAESSPREVLARWVPVLAPGVCGAAFHGVIRTAHAWRALQRESSEERRGELAIGLAYWAARYLPLPAIERSRDPRTLYGHAFRELAHPWGDEEPPVGYFSAPGIDLSNLTPFAPAVDLKRANASPAADLAELVRGAAEAFIAMMAQRRNGFLLLHAVTGPAAAGLLLSSLEDEDAHALVEYAWQGAAAMHMAYGAAFPPPSKDAAPPPWSELIERTVETRGMHAIKLTEGLRRMDRDGDPVWRAAAAAWLENR